MLCESHLHVQRVHNTKGLQCLTIEAGQYADMILVVANVVDRSVNALSQLYGCRKPLISFWITVCVKRCLNRARVCMRLCEIAYLRIAARTQSFVMMLF